jgi:hypothetical protein
MRLFTLQRNVDVSGISGTGVVAEGCEFSDGQCAIAWQSAMPSVCLRDSLAQVEAIHGHGGNTQAILQSPFYGRQGYRPFWLGHTENRHGLSGVGLVAECCLFSNGWVVMRWLVDPHGIEIFTSYADWEKVHDSLPHTYTKTQVPYRESVEVSPFDVLFSGHRAYRRFSKGAWFCIRVPSVPFKGEAWARNLLEQDDLIGVEVFR